MKIVYVDETFHPAYGYQSNPLAKFQQKQGNEVVIITVDKDHLHPVYKAFGDNGDSILDDDIRYTNDTGVKILRIPTKGFFMHRAVYGKDLFSTVRKEKPDVVFVHCVETLTAMRFLLHKKEWPLMFDSHMLSMASESKFVGCYEAVYRFFFRRIIEHHNYIVVRTQNDDYVNKHLGIKSSLTPFISFGTDTSLFIPSDDEKKKFRMEHNIPMDSFVVIYTGKLTEAKGGLLLAKSFQQKFKSDITLVCVGTPPEDEYGKQVVELLKKSENRIIQFPTQGYLDLPKYYQMADLSIFPRQCSMSFYDAQACGLPVLSEQNNVNEQRCSHDNGMNFIPGDVNDLRNKIEQFASMSNNQLKSYSSNARRFIEDGYDYAEIAKKYTELLQQTIQKKV